MDDILFFTLKVSPSSWVNREYRAHTRHGSFHLAFPWSHWPAFFSTVVYKSSMGLSPWWQTSRLLSCSVFWQLAINRSLCMYCTLHACPFRLYTISWKLHTAQCTLLTTHCKAMYKSLQSVVNPDSMHSCQTWEMFWRPVSELYDHRLNLNLWHYCLRLRCASQVEVHDWA